MTELLSIILGLVLLIALDLVLVAARACYSMISHARLLVLREQMTSRVNRVLSLLEHINRVQASLNLALVLVRFLIAGMLLMLLFNPQISVNWFAVRGILLKSGLNVFWLEWSLVQLVSRSPNNWALRLGVFVQALTILFSVFLIPLGLTRDAQDPGESVGSVTEDDLKILVDAGEEEGVFEQDERRMIYSIIQLGETLVREIMVPRIDMMTFDVHTSLSDAVDTFIESGHSRVPVHEDTVDNTIGLLYAKDLLRVWREGSQLGSLGDLLRPAYFVPEAKKVDELLAEMQSRRIHIALVVDEYGGVAGLVTLEDITEEILGEIQDEYDQGEEQTYQVLKDGEYMFLGRVDIDDFNEIMQCRLPTDDADTLGGYIYSSLGHVPSVGENVRKGDLVLTVEQVSARRIRKVRAHWLSAEKQAEGEVNNVNR